MGIEVLALSLPSPASQCKDFSNVIYFLRGRKLFVYRPDVTTLPADFVSRCV